MARFGLLFEQEFTATDTITITHNLNRYVFNVRCVISGDPALSRRELIQDIELDLATPLDKMIVKLTGIYTGKIQLISEDTIQSPYYTVDEKLASQVQTALAGTFPIKFEYGGNSNTNRVLEYTSFDNSRNSPFIAVGDGNIRAVSFFNAASSTGSHGVYKKDSPSDILLYTISYTNEVEKVIKPLEIAISDGDEIYVKQSSGTSLKPVIVIYFQTI